MKCNSPPQDPGFCYFVKKLHSKNRTSIWSKRYSENEQIVITYRLKMIKHIKHITK